MSIPNVTDLIHLGGETAVVVPIDEWVAAGRPGALSHEEVMAERLDVITIERADRVI
jgi:hypothetical protein